MVGSPAPVNRLCARTCHPGKLSRAASGSKDALASRPRTGLPPHLDVTVKIGVARAPRLRRSVSTRSWASDRAARYPNTAKTHRHH